MESVLAVVTLAAALVSPSIQAAAVPTDTRSALVESPELAGVAWTGILARDTVAGLELGFTVTVPAGWSVNPRVMGTPLPDPETGSAPLVDRNPEDGESWNAISVGQRGQPAYRILIAAWPSQGVSPEGFAEQTVINARRMGAMFNGTVEITEEPAGVEVGGLPGVVGAYDLVALPGMRNRYYFLQHGDTMYAIIERMVTGGGRIDVDETVIQRMVASFAIAPD